MDFRCFLFLFFKISGIKAIGILNFFSLTVLNIAQEKDINGILFLFVQSDRDCFFSLAIKHSVKFVLYLFVFNCFHVYLFFLSIWSFDWSKRFRCFVKHELILNICAFTLYVLLLRKRCRVRELFHGYVHACVFMCFRLSVFSCFSERSTYIF